MVSQIATAPIATNEADFPMISLRVSGTPARNCMTVDQEQAIMRRAQPQRGAVVEEIRQYACQQEPATQRAAPGQPGRQGEQW